MKPSIADTMKLNVYADNWFMLYVNGRLVAVDSIQFTPHNVVSVDFLPEYPMTIAVLAKGQRRPETGMEYGTSIGDAGLCIKFADGTVTNATWKAKNFFHGPVNGDTANPKSSKSLFPNWWAIDLDDSTWKNAERIHRRRSRSQTALLRNDSKAPSSSGPTTSPSTTPSSSAPKSKTRLDAKMEHEARFGCEWRAFE